MNIQITSVNVRYNAENQVEKVQVHFSGTDESRTINVSGYVPLTAEEYAGNEAISALAGIVRQEVSTKVLEVPSA